jgi:hypothetical protein
LHDHDAPVDSSSAHLLSQLVELGILAISVRLLRSLLLCLLCRLLRCYSLPYDLPAHRAISLDACFSARDVMSPLVIIAANRQRLFRA